MDYPEDHELEVVERRLRAARAQLEPDELDRVRHRVLADAPPPRHARRRFAGLLALPRVATTALLVAGFLVTGASAGLAVSGTSGSGSAGDAQYPRNDTSGGGNTPDLGGVNGTDQNGNVGVEDENTADTQLTRQIASTDSDRLPFTGLAAIPLLLVGAGMIVSGGLLRRRSSA
jgi:hypothetical protein